MTNPKNATLLAAATLLLAVVGLFFIDDWLPDFPFWANVFSGHLNLGGFRISFSWIVMLASVATCWAAFVEFAFPDREEPALTERQKARVERDTGRWNRRQNRKPRAF